MKPGTLVKCPLWGKGIVVEELFQINGPGTRPVVLVLWNKPKTTHRGVKLTTLKICVGDLTIISEVAE